MQVNGDFDGFPLECFVGVGHIMTTVKFSSDTADGRNHAPFDMGHSPLLTGFFYTPGPQVVSRISSIKSVEGAIVSQFAVDMC